MSSSKPTLAHLQQRFRGVLDNLRRKKKNRSSSTSTRFDGPRDSLAPDIERNPSSDSAPPPLTTDSRDRLIWAVYMHPVLHGRRRGMKGGSRTDAVDLRAHQIPAHLLESERWTDLVLSQALDLPKIKAIECPWNNLEYANPIADLLFFQTVDASPDDGHRLLIPAQFGTCPTAVARAFQGPGTKGDLLLARADGEDLFCDIVWAMVRYIQQVAFEVGGRKIERVLAGGYAEHEKMVIRSLLKEEAFYYAFETIECQGKQLGDYLMKRVRSQIEAPRLDEVDARECHPVFLGEGQRTQWPGKLTSVLLEFPCIQCGVKISECQCDRSEKFSEQKMCGRFSLWMREEQVARYWEAHVIPLLAHETALAMTEDLIPG